ncbi:amidase signature domain-containing protein [Diaporthe sp. PMI_573]|nr:amidase signature domain-containing protein [Diaporthaceae sp. PMI_573]
MTLKHLITCIVAGIDYLVHPQILGSVEESVRADQVIPVVVLSEEEVNAGPEELGRTLQFLVDNDDVCTDDFTGIIVVKPSGSAPELHGACASTSDIQASIDCPFTIYHMANGLDTAEEKDLLPSGPYFLSGQNLHQAWRLYPDELDAFTFGLLPDNPFGPQSFRAVAPLSSDGVSKTIPVPSRFYHRPDSRKPLAGKRVALTDTFDVKGAKTTLSSRAWTQLYPAADASAAYVKKLLDLGAVVVGKTRTTQFTTGLHWVDHHAPVNPRGDRYHEASGSSVGAASSLAAYNWLDFAVGADSDGGVRNPAADHGLHALRSSYNSASLEGLKVSSERYETVGLFGRRLEDLVSAAQHSLAVSDRNVELPRHVFYPTDYFPLVDVKHQKLVEQFVQNLETHLDVRRIEVNIAQLWEDYPPSTSPTVRMPLQQYLRKAPFWSLCHDYYHGFDQFRADYSDAVGREPFVEASPRYRWNIGEHVTNDDYDEYLTRLDTFRTWFEKTVMSLTSESDDIMILPAGIAAQKYRDEPPSEPEALDGMDVTLLSPVLGTPQIVVPFAQLPYKSHVTESLEYRPVSASIMGARGTDLALLRLVEEATQAAGWRTNIDTGRRAFPVGKNSRHVRDLGDDGRGGEVYIQQHVAGLGSVSESAPDEL